MTCEKSLVSKLPVSGLWEWSVCHSFEAPICWPGPVSVWHTDWYRVVTWDTIRRVVTWDRVDNDGGIVVLGYVDQNDIKSDSLPSWQVHHHQWSICRVVTRWSVNLRFFLLLGGE